MTNYNIPLLDIYDFFGNLIADNITDPEGRTKWIFPDFATQESSLPQITILYENPEYEVESAGEYLTSDFDSETGIYSEYFRKKANTKLHIYILTSKVYEKQVTLNSTNYLFKNKLYNTYLSNQVKNLMLTSRGTVLLYNQFFNFNVENLESPFESNIFTWASDLRCDLSFYDTWVNEYEGDQLIASYSLTQNITT